MTVGAIIDRPQTTAKQKTGDQWSPLLIAYPTYFGGSKPPPYEKTQFTAKRDGFVARGEGAASTKRLREREIARR